VLIITPRSVCRHPPPLALALAQANVLLAAGCSPAMAQDPNEVEDFVTIASALLVNIGTMGGARLACTTAARAATAAQQLAQRDSTRLASRTSGACSVSLPAASAAGEGRVPPASSPVGPPHAAAPRRCRHQHLEGRKAGANHPSPPPLPRLQAPTP